MNFLSFEIFLWYVLTYFNVYSLYKENRKTVRTHKWYKIWKIYVSEVYTIIFQRLFFCAIFFVIMYKMCIFLKKNLFIFMYFELNMQTELELVAYVAMNEIVWECTKDKKIQFQHSKRNTMCSNIYLDNLIVVNCLFAFNLYK